MNTIIYEYNIIYEYKALFRTSSDTNVKHATHNCRMLSFFRLGHHLLGPHLHPPVCRVRSHSPSSEQCLLRARYRQVKYVVPKLMACDKSYAVWIWCGPTKHTPCLLSKLE